MRNSLMLRIAGKTIAWALIVMPLGMVNILLGFAAMVWLSIGEKVMETRGIRTQQDIRGFQIKAWLIFFYWAAWWPRYLASHPEGGRTYFGRLIAKIIFVWLLSILLLSLHFFAAILGLAYLLCGEWVVTRSGELPPSVNTVLTGICYEVKRLSKALIWPVWYLEIFKSNRDKT